MIEEFDTQEIWADYEYGKSNSRLLDKTFVESKHYFELLKSIEEFIEDNKQILTDSEYETSSIHYLKHIIGNYG